MTRGGSIAEMRLAIRQAEGGSTPTPPLSKRDWRVELCDLTTARQMVKRHHYSRGGSNTAVYTFGLFPIYAGPLLGEPVAVSWWLPPTKVCGASVWPSNPQGVLALSRLVAVPTAPKNAASFLLSHSIRQIDRQRWPILITFADTWQGHTGAIYRAAGWMPCGRTKPEATYVRDGRMVCRKAGPKTRSHDEMLSLGCEFVGRHRRLRFVHVREDLREQFEKVRTHLQETR